MYCIRMLSKMVLFIFTLSIQTHGQESNIHRNEDFGIEIHKPDSWYFKIKDDSHLSLRILPSFMKNDSIPARFVLVVSTLPGMTSRELVPLRETLWKGSFGDTYRKIKQDTILIADEIAYYLIGDYGIASTRIAFISEMGEAKEVMTIDYDGHGMHFLLS